jgi:hypothetical protein
MEVFIMNKLVKKSLAGVLAGVMAATSLVGSISAMAVAYKPTDEEITGIKAVALNQKVTFEKAAAGATETVYEFTTPKAAEGEKTVKYVIDFTSDAVISDAKTKKRDDTAARLGVYEVSKDYKEVSDKKFQVDSFTAGANTYTYFIGVGEKEATVISNTANAKSVVYAYNDGTKTVELKPEQKYAFAIEFWGQYPNTDEKTKATKPYIETKAYMTLSNYVEAPAAKFHADEKSDDVGSTLPTQTITRTAKANNGTYYATVTDSPSCTVSYIGTEADIVVPDVFEGYRVIGVNGLAVADIIKNNVKSLTLGKNVTSVAGFENCPKLATVNFNDGLETIGVDAFAHDTGLTGKLVLPASVKTIGAGAFYDTRYDSASITNVETTMDACGLGVVQVLNEATANPNDLMDAVKDGFFITAPAKATNVVKYGKDNGIAVIDPANCTHIYGEAVVKAATIYAAGSKTQTCAVCGNVATEAIAQKKVTIKSVKSSKKGAITVKTNAVTDKVTAYKVQYATKKDFSNAKTVTVKTTKKALSKTITGLKAGKKYYVRVKAVNGSKKSAFTAKKAVTVKK